MLVNVVGDAGARGFAKVEAHVEAARAVNLTQDEFGALGEEHQLVGSIGRHSGKRGEMLIRHDHDVASGVRVSVEAYEAVRPAMDDVDRLFRSLARHAVGDGVVDGGDHVAKDAVLVVGVGRRPGVAGRGQRPATQIIFVAMVRGAVRCIQTSYDSKGFDLQG